MAERTGLELRSTVSEDGTLTLNLEEVAVGVPGPDEVVVRVEAAPINPSDPGPLLSPADVESMQTSGAADRPVAT